MLAQGMIDAANTDAAAIIAEVISAQQEGAHNVCAYFTSLYAQAGSHAHYLPLIFAAITIIADIYTALTSALCYSFISRFIDTFILIIYC